MKNFHLQIATPDGIKYNGECESVLVRCADGDIEILAGHTELVASLAVGRVRILYAGTERFASASSGFVCVTKDGVKLVATTFEFADEIDVKRAEAARERAEELLRSAKDDAALQNAEAKLSRALSRIKVSKM